MKMNDFMLQRGGLLRTDTPHNSTVGARHEERLKRLFKVNNEEYDYYLPWSMHNEQKRARSKYGWLHLRSSRNEHMAGLLYHSFIGMLEVHSMGTAQEAFCVLGQRYIIQASSLMLCPYCEASPLC